MQVGQSLEDRLEHRESFVRSQWTLWQNLGQILLCVFHDQVQEGMPAELTAARLEGRQQMLMRKCRGGLPARQLRVRMRRMCRDQLDRRVGQPAALVLGQKYRAVIGGTQEAAQRKPAVDDLTLPPRPDLAHRYTNASTSDESDAPLGTLAGRYHQEEGACLCGSAHNRRTMRTRRLRDCASPACYLRHPQADGSAGRRSY